MTPSIPFEEPTRGTGWPRLIARGLVAGAILGAMFHFGPGLDQYLDRLDELIGSQGPAAPLAFVIVFIAAIPLFVPVSAMKLMAGALFGPWLGMLVALVAQLAAAALMYFAGRRLFAERLRAWIATQPRLAAVEHAAAEGSARRQFFLRMTPLSFALVSYLLAALGVGLRPYMIGCLASVPSTIATVWFAHTAVRATELADGATPAEIRWEAIAFTVVVVGFGAIAWFARRSRRELRAETAVSPAETA